MYPKIILALSCTLISAPLLAGTLSGTVSAAGKPLNGAMLTLSSTDALRSETVFADAAGNYRLDTALSGKLTLRVRMPYHQDATQTVTLAAQEQRTLTVNLTPMISDQEISDSQPAVAHFASLPFAKEGPFTRTNLQAECTSCHQLGNALTRWPRTAANWLPTVQRMHAYNGNDDKALMQARADFLAAGFTGKPVTTRIHYVAAPELAHARITQYAIPEASMPHDADVHRQLNKAFSVDQNTDGLYVTDLTSGLTQNFRAPDGGMPPGGKFTLLNIGGGAYAHKPPRGMHSLALGSDGNYYTTDSFAGGLSIFDPRTNKWGETINIPGKAMYPHTIRADKNGHVWFTVTFSEQVGRLDIATRKVELIDLPAAKTISMPSSTIPYGIDINPVDGTVWISRMNADKIGRIDPVTMTYTEFSTPFRAPRRLRFDAQGTLWVAGFAEGKLAKIRTSDFNVTLYDLPRLIADQPAAPYALAVHPETQEVWVNEVMGNQLLRFLPKEERFIAYPLPLNGSFTRDVSFPADGRACTSTSPQPLGAIEGGVAQLVCIDTGKTN